MESLASYFMLFLAGVSALVTYLIVPRLPAVALGSIAALALIAGVWWHWNQFATEYRTSTWQEYLRSWGSYVMVFAVIFLSYGVYAVTAGGSSSVAVTKATGRSATPTPNMSNNTGAGGNIFNVGTPAPEPITPSIPSAPAAPEPIIPTGAPGRFNLNLGLGGNTGNTANLTKKNGNMNRNRSVNGVNFLT